MKEFRYYLLNDDGSITPTNDTLAWSRWFEEFKNRQIAFTKVTEDIDVSTVALGLDHSWGDGPPMIFETMSFGTKDEKTRRYSTVADAKAGHEEVVNEIREELGLLPENPWNIDLLNIMDDKND